jgi:hypothetical protein
MRFSRAESFANHVVGPQIEAPISSSPSVDAALRTNAGAKLKMATDRDEIAVCGSFGRLRAGYRHRMEKHLTAASNEIVDYLAREAPWELERFRSLDRLVSGGLDWADGSTQALLVSYSSWLQEMFSLFRNRAAFE